MERIAHRINTIEELHKLPREYGVEIDLRDFGERLVLQHDPFKDGEDFEEYLKNYNHRTMILNIKSEGIEYKVLELIQKYNIKKYFFLDCTFPLIYLLSRGGEKNIALRFSEFEGIDTILSMEGKVQWVWVDCFSQFPLDSHDASRLREKDFKLCFVSPELQGRTERLHVSEFRREIEIEGIIGDAVCTKYLDLWD